jgi:hypothetical protein
MVKSKTYRYRWHAIWLAISCLLACFAIKWGDEMGVNVNALFKRHVKNVDSSGCDKCGLDNYLYSPFIYNASCAFQAMSQVN